MLLYVSSFYDRLTLDYQIDTATKLYSSVTLYQRVLSHHLLYFWIYRTSTSPRLPAYRDQLCTRIRYSNWRKLRFLLLYSNLNSTTFQRLEARRHMPRRRWIQHLQPVHPGKLLSAMSSSLHMRRVLSQPYRPSHAWVCAWPAIDAETCQQHLLTTTICGGETSMWVHLSSWIPKRAHSGQECEELGPQTQLPANDATPSQLHHHAYLVQHIWAQTDIIVRYCMWHHGS